MISTAPVTQSSAASDDGTRCRSSHSSGGTSVTATVKATVTGRKNAAPAFSANGMLKNRSEEHTSELQSLMRISYAVFCLKKKKKKRKKELTCVNTDDHNA